MKGLMKIKLISVIVRDQEHALGFYTEVLGFIKKTEFPVGDHKWLTVVSPEEPDGACMVSSEGACANSFRFGQRR